jgi:hypothetical protein
MQRRYLRVSAAIRPTANQLSINQTTTSQSPLGSAIEAPIAHTDTMDNLLTQKTPTGLAIAQAVGITGSVFLLGRTSWHSIHAVIVIAINRNAHL